MLTFALALPATAKSLLQSYVGQTYSAFMTDTLNISSPAIVINNTSVCADLSAAIGAGFAARGGNPTIISIANPEEATSPVEVIRRHFTGTSQGKLCWSYLFSFAGVDAQIT
ncbi:MAG: hypothetical protein ACK4QL_09975 [Pseudanabaenaceae cyanobacterium]